MTATMSRVRGLRSALVVAVVAAVLVGAGSAQAATTVKYRVVSATASVTLVFASRAEDRVVTGRSDVRVRSARTRGSRATGSLGGRSGRVAVTVRGTNAERAVIGERSDPTSPYVEQNCGNRRRLAGTGGFALRRVRSRVEVRWLFPHAAMRFCPGPAAVGRLLAKKMRRMLPAARFRARRLTVVVSGTSRFRTGAYSGTYRWRGAVVLARL